jgi:hypothetical protein
MIGIVVSGEVNGFVSPADAEFLGESYGSALPYGVAGNGRGRGADERFATNLDREGAFERLFNERVALLDEPVADPLLDDYIQTDAAAERARLGYWPLDEREAAVLNALIYMRRARRWQAIRGWVTGFSLIAIGAAGTAAYFGWESLAGRTELFWGMVTAKQWIAGVLGL